MDIRESVPVGSKTTMRMGGVARWYGEILTREDVAQAVAFASEKKIPLIVFGGGSNTIFADGTIEALVVRMKAETMTIDGKTVKVRAGKILGSLLNELAERGLDLSPLTGIPGTLGGAVFGNAGQGAGGIWIGSYVRDVTAYVDNEWRTFTKEECGFAYRESAFKGPAHQRAPHPNPLPRGEGKIHPIIWEATLDVPHGDPPAIKSEIERLIQKRIKTQPHLKTAGSCSKSRPDGTQAWKLIDAAGLRGHRIGGIEIAQKHANFLLNVGNGTFDDAKRIVEFVKTKVPDALDVEMRFIQQDGSLVF